MKEKLLQITRSYIGTPFKLHGRVKGIGCDCLGLLIGVAQELQLKDKKGRQVVEYDTADYTLHASGEELLMKLDMVFEVSKDIEIGNLVVLSYDSNPQHLGIIGDHPQGISLIHSYLPLQKVVEHRLDAEHLAKVKKVYKLYSELVIENNT